MLLHYRPQFLWLLFGPFLGAFSGAVVATMLVWVVALAQATALTPSDVLAGFVGGLIMGVIYGGMVGTGVGLVVGVPLVFLVGRHLPRDVARHRARALGAVLPPVTLVVGTALLVDDGFRSPGAEGLWVLLPLAGAALLGSRLAGWLAAMDDVSRPVS